MKIILAAAGVAVLAAGVAACGSAGGHSATAHHTTEHRAATTDCWMESQDQTAWVLYQQFGNCQVPCGDLPLLRLSPQDGGAWTNQAPIYLRSEFGTPACTVRNWTVYDQSPKPTAGDSTEGLCSFLESEG